MPKTFGWGLHFDATGRITLHAVGSREYLRLSMDPPLTQLQAMRPAAAAPDQRLRRGTSSSKHVAPVKPSGVPVVPGQSGDSLQAEPARSPPVLAGPSGLTITTGGRRVHHGQAA